MSSSLTLHRSFLQLILLAYYSVSYSKESFSNNKKKEEHDTVQSNSLEQSPDPTCGTQAWEIPAGTTPSRGCTTASQRSRDGERHPAKGVAQPSPSDSLGHEDTFSNTSKDGPEETASCLHKNLWWFYSLSPPSHLEKSDTVTKCCTAPQLGIASRGCCRLKNHWTLSKMTDCSHLVLYLTDVILKGEP